MPLLGKPQPPQIEGDPAGAAMPEGVLPIYGTKVAASAAPRLEMPEGPMPAGVAKQLIMDELALDGNPQLNLASFVTTYMEPEADDVVLQASRKNLVALDQSPETRELQERCVDMLTRLYHAPGCLSENKDTGAAAASTSKSGPVASHAGAGASAGLADECHPGVGTSTVGSSEAVMLAGLAMKWRWREFRRRQGKDTSRPNIVMGANVQVVWHKFCRYFEVEAREAAATPECLVMTAAGAKELVDENTIGICAILGSTFNGEYENVQEIHDMAVELNKQHGWDLCVHVDAASGGFIAPFLTPELVWDFRLPLVKSINVSGHKFGLVYPGVGWVLWREEEDMPRDLLLNISHLAGERVYYGINFSRGCGQLVASYYMMLRLGKAGYRAILEASMENAAYLRQRLVETGKFAIHDKAHMPLVAFSLKDPNTNLFDVQERLRLRGWIVPAYTCPPKAESLTIMRVVVRQTFSRDMADMLLQDIDTAIHALESHTQAIGPTPSSAQSPDDELTAPEERGKGIAERVRKEWRVILGALAFRKRDATTYGVC